MGEWKVARAGVVAIITMDDGKANTVTLPEFESLGRALAEVRDSDASSVVLAGRPGYFSAGLNLKVLPNLSTAELQTLITRFGEVVLDLMLFPKPIVAAVTGHALGAGAIFGFASDVRLFAEGNFKFGLNEVAAGLFVPTFAIVMAKISAPAEHLNTLVMHGRVVNPAQALELRIAESLHAPEGLLPAALARAEQLAEISHPNYAYTKVLLRGPLAEEARRNLPIEVARLGEALTAKR